jgi:hypothetical protein
VNGNNQAPLYKYLKSQKGGGLLGDNIKWNFAKFLVDKNGKVVDRYAPTTSPSKIQVTFVACVFPFLCLFFPVCLHCFQSLTHSPHILCGTSNLLWVSCYDMYESFKNPTNGNSVAN